MLPSAVVAVIAAVPAFTPVTFPVLSTVAIELFEDVQIIALFVAFTGVTVAIKLYVAPTASSSVSAVKLTAVTLTTGAMVLVNVQVAVLLPSAVVAVIIAVPAFTAVTFPVLSTVAIALLEVVQFTALFVAFDGATVADKLYVPPTNNAFIVEVKLTDVTLTTGASATVTVQVAVLLPSAVVAVIIAVPALIAVTFPVLSTAAIALSEVVQVTALFVAFAGAIVADKVSVAPTV